MTIKDGSSSNVNSLPNMPSAGSKTSGTLPGDKGKAPQVPSGTKPQVTGSGIQLSTADISTLADPTISINQLYVTQDPTTKQFLTEYVDPAGHARWAALVANPASSTGYSIVTNEDAYNQAIIKQGIALTGSIKEFKALLARKGGYGSATQRAVTTSTNDTGLDTTFQTALKNYLNEQSRTALVTGNVTDAISYLNGRPNYAGTRTTTTTSYTSQISAANDIDKFMMEELGRHANQSEMQGYYNALHVYEQKNPTKATVTTDGLGMEKDRTQISGPSAEDIKAVMVASVMPSLEKAGKDPSAISQLGGSIGANILKINQRAAQQGVNNIITPAKAFEAAVAAVQPGASVDQELTKIDQLAMAQPKYKSFAPALNLGYTMQDLAKPYADHIAKYLEKPTVTPDLNNPLIMQGLTGGANGGAMDDNSFIKLVKSQPEWMNTNNAKEEVSSLVNKMGQLMGFSA